MASIIRDKRRGSWLIQWWNGERWARKTVAKCQSGWKPAKGMPAKDPPQVVAALADFLKKERLARGGNTQAAELPIPDFLDGYLASYRVTRAALSARELEKAIAVFVGWCEAQNLRSVKDVTSEVCNQWIAARGETISKLTARPVARATIQKEKGLLAGAWAEGLKTGKVDRNPWSKIGVPGKPSSKRRGSWTPEEYARLLAACKPWLRDIIIIGCHCGLRVEALIGLEWRDVRWNEVRTSKSFGFIDVRPELDKSGKGYSVPIHKELHDVLLRRLIHKPGDVETIVTGMKGRPLKTSGTTHEAIVLACKKAGLRKPDSPNHHLRRTFGRWAVLGHLRGEPVPRYVVSQWMGHASVKMTEHYLDLPAEDSSNWMAVK